MNFRKRLEMISRKKTNYEIHKKDILKRASDSSLCFNCQARSMCYSLCKRRGIDTESQKLPCYEAWLKWADMKVK